MPHRPVALLSALAISAAIMPGAALAQPLKLDIGNSNGICSVGIPAGDNGLKLEFTIRKRDLNINVTLHNISGDIVNAALDEDEEPEIDLVFDGRHRFELDWGSYVAGFTYRAVGGWDDPARAADALDMLKTASNVTFVADNNKWGPISLQQKGVIFNILENCVLEAQQQGN